MNRLVKKLHSATQRQNRVRSKMHGTAQKPRLSVFISNKHISAQLIDDDNHVSLAGFSSVGKKTTGTKVELAEYVGSEIAKIAKSKKIKKVVFDRGPKLYHGRVKAFAESARKEGLEF